MLQARRLPDPASIADRLHPALEARPLTPARVARDAPDEHWVVEREGLIVARTSLWWRGVATWPDARLGYVGHYASADLEAGRAVLAHACEALAQRGASRVVGPLDGSTWRSYRLVTDAGTAPPFLLEPETPLDWVAHFEAEGFDVFARYTSALVEPLEPPPSTLAEAEGRLEAAGYTFRTIDLGQVDRELDRLFELSLAAFADNVLYTPIARDEFLEQYAQVLPAVDPRLVHVAEHDDALVGYVFSVPDHLETARTQHAPRTVIVKTLAVHPSHTGAGLGGVLTGRAQRSALSLGYVRAIHALMLETNASQRISRRYGRTCRQYALFSKAIA